MKEIIFFPPPFPFIKQGCCYVFPTEMLKVLWSSHISISENLPTEICDSEISRLPDSTSLCFPRYRFGSPGGFLFVFVQERWCGLFLLVIVLSPVYVLTSCLLLKWSWEERKGRAFRWEVIVTCGPGCEKYNESCKVVVFKVSNTTFCEWWSTNPWK